MTQHQGISVELDAFIRKELSLSAKRALAPDDGVQSDLGVTGDDAAYFMESYFNYFNVEVGDFDFARYFAGEGSFDPVASFISLIFRRRGAKYERRPLTVSMLQQAIDLDRGRYRLSHECLLFLGQRGPATALHQLDAGEYGPQVSPDIVRKGEHQPGIIQQLSLPLRIERLTFCHRIRQFVRRSRPRRRFPRTPAGTAVTWCAGSWW